MKKILITLLMVITVLLTTATAFAGNGDGTGGGKSEGLYVKSASIEDGGVLASGEAITLVFSKNVVNKKVVENNMPLFQVLDSDQAEVAIEVIMADDQVEPDKKNDVVIQFPQGLADGTYTLTAKGGITSKSGDVMEADHVLTFRAGSTQAPEEAPEQTPEQTSEPEQTPEQAPEPAPAQTPEQAPETAAPAAAPEGKNMMPVIIAVVVLAAAGGFVVLRKKK